MTETQQQVIKWLAMGEVGLSSRCMALWLGFGQLVLPHERLGPADPGDLDRCLRLLAWAPGLRPMLPKMAEVSPAWAALTARWDEVEASHLAEVGLGWLRGRRAPTTFALMESIRWPQPADPAVTLRAAMESRELDREAHDLFEQADAADEHDTPRGRERARRLREAAEAALVQADALMAHAKVDVAAAAAGGAAAVARVAEAEVARLAAEVTQARADALVLAGLTGHTALELIPEGSALDVALDAAIAHAETISDDEVIAIIRRTLGGAQ